jgi:hypothetical protein
MPVTVGLELLVRLSQKLLDSNWRIYFRQTANQIMRSFSDVYCFLACDFLWNNILYEKKSVQVLEFLASEKV